MKKAKQPVRKRVVVDPEYTTPAKAVSIWLAVLAHTKMAVFDEVEEMPADLELTEDQLEAIEANAPILTLVGHRSPVVSIAICPECGRWALCTSATKTKCKMTFGCSGRPVRVQPAKRVPITEAIPATGETSTEQDRAIETD